MVDQLLPPQLGLAKLTADHVAGLAQHAVDHTQLLLQTLSA
jgi:hypothetical protein